MKKVVHLLPSLGQDGVGRVVCSLNRALVGRGWKSVVVSAGWMLADEIERNGGTHRQLDLQSGNPLTFPARAWRLRRLLKAESPDLVCVHSRVPAWLFSLANVGLGIPFVTYAHEASAISRHSAVMTRGLRVVTPTIFLADALKESFRFDAAKLRVIPPAVDADRFNPLAVDSAFAAQKWLEWKLAGKFVIMAVGRLSRESGLGNLVAALGELRKESSDYRCVFVGDADPSGANYPEELRVIAARCGVERDIVFAGGQAKIPECLSLADVVVFPNAMKPESFGLSMAETICMGKAVVAKGVGGVLEVVRDGVDGVLTAGDSPSDFAAAIARVRREKMRPSREEAVARFGFEGIATRTCELYDELTKGNKEAK